MTVAQIMEGIQQLSPAEQAEIIRFAYRLDATRKLSGEELEKLADRMANSTDPRESILLREAIMQGFYGTQDDA